MSAAASPQSVPNPYGRIGGEIVVRAIVDRFYDLVEQDSRFVALRGIHAADLGPVRHGLTSSDGSAVRETGSNAAPAS